MSEPKANRVSTFLVSLALLPLVLGPQTADSTHTTPAPQPPLADVSQDSLASLRSAFNAASDRPRVLAMFSPT